VVPDLTGAAADSDVCISFLINGGAFRGRLVRLDASVTDILHRHGDPPAVSALLAEALAAATALAGALKYAGVFTLQIQGDGPVSMLVADVTSDGALRACAKFHPERLAAELAHTRAGGLAPHLLGNGHLAFTVDQGPDTERYQGIVALAGGTLADSVHTYFRQSEQLDSALKLAVAPTPNGGWRAAALLVQRMPEEGGAPLPATAEERDDAWRTAVILLGSLREAELLDPALDGLRLLYRLYATVGVRALKIKPVRAQCRCSRDRSARIIASFPLSEVRALSDDGAVHMTCEFCRTVYDFALDELERLVRDEQIPPMQGAPP
jgi:molecular chaperone Hsp33